MSTKKAELLDYITEKYWKVGEPKLLWQDDFKNNIYQIPVVIIDWSNFRDSNLQFVVEWEGTKDEIAFLKEDPKKKEEFADAVNAEIVNKESGGEFLKWEIERASDKKEYAVVWTYVNDKWFVQYKRFFVYYVNDTLQFLETDLSVK